MDISKCLIDPYNGMSFDEDDEDFVEFLIILALGEIGKMYFGKQLCRASALRGHDYVLQVINGNPIRCYESFRMKADVFIQLCEELKNHGLKHLRDISAQEKIAMFLYLISHNERTQIVAERYQHSMHTVSSCFRKVLKVVCKLGVLVVRPSSFDEVPDRICHNPMYYPFFKGCVGAIDGTHILAHVPGGQHTIPTQNIMCVCSFDMRFTYVLCGWEETANDSRILTECVNNPAMEFPKPNQDQYYVVDSGYPNMPGFLAPYKRTRYHLRDYCGDGCQPRGPQEWFNYRHSSLRIVIERCFGVLKARFPILKDMPSFGIRTEKYIPIACCTIHNFIRMHDLDDELFDNYSQLQIVDNLGEGSNSNSQNAVTINISKSQIRQMGAVRDEIARQIYETVNVG